VAPGADRGNQQLPAIPSGLCAAAGVALRCVALRCGAAMHPGVQLASRRASRSRFRALCRCAAMFLLQTGDNGMTARLAASRADFVRAALRPGNSSSTCQLDQ
jgi:hypothetical protein